VQIFLEKNKKYFYSLGLSILILFPLSYVSATLSCSVTTSALCSDTVILRMSDSLPLGELDSTPGYNAQAELPSQSTATYDDYVVCCNGVTGLGNSCSGNYEVVARLSGVTNAHVEKNTEVGVNYTEDACISSSFAGDEISIGYQSTNCDGYDTTLFSMASTPTNSQVGSPASYNNKVCAKVFSQSLTFNISDNSIGFGNLTSSGLRYATGNGTGGSSEVEAFNFTVNTNAPSGYIVSMQGETLKKGATEITAIGGTNTVPSAGTKNFGLRAVATGGSGTVSAPYAASGFAYDAESSFDSIASASSGDGVTTTYSVRTVATIDELLDPGDYVTNLTYIVTANF